MKGNLFFTFSPFSLLSCLRHIFFPSISFVLLSFAFPYIVLAISQSTNESYSSISGGDPSLLGKADGSRVNTESPFISFSLYFLSPSCFYSLTPSLYLFATLSHSLSVSQEIALKAGCMQNYGSSYGCVS